VVENTRNVLAIEAMAAARAVEFLAPLRTSTRLQSAVAAIRKISPTMEHDRAMYQDFARIAGAIAEGSLAIALR
jgi:histidine ammonia-lyase